MGIRGTKWYEVTDLNVTGRKELECVTVKSEARVKAVEPESKWHKALSYVVMVGIYILESVALLGLMLCLAKGFEALLTIGSCI